MQPLPLDSGSLLHWPWLAELSCAPLSVIEQTVFVKGFAQNSLLSCVRRFPRLAALI
jgi:hypothetical protein